MKVERLTKVRDTGHGFGELCRSATGCSAIALSLSIWP